MKFLERFQKNTAEATRLKLRYAMTYFVVAIVASGLILMLLYQHFYEQIQHHSAEMVLSTATAQQQAIDRTIAEMQELVIQLRTDPELSHTRLSIPGFETYTARRTLNRYVTANSLYMEIALAFPLDPTRPILSSRGTYQRAVFPSYMPGEDLHNYIRRFELHLDEGPRVFSSSSDGLVFAFPSRSYQIEASRLLLVSVSKAKFSQLLTTSFHGGQANLSILNAQTGEIVYQHSPSPLPEMDYDILQDQGKLFFRSASHEYAVASSSTLPWYYVYDEPSDPLQTQIQLLQKRVVLVVCITILPTLLLAYLMGGAAYRPLRRLISLVGGERPESTDTLRQLTGKVEEIMHRNRRLAEQLTNYATITQDYILQLLLLGHSPHGDTAQLMSMADLELPHPYFTVMYFPISIKGLDSRAHVQSRLEMLSLLRNAAAHAGISYAIEWINAALVLLINHETPQINTSFLEDLQPVLDSRFQYSSTCGLGISVDSLEALPHSMMHAIAASEYARFKGWPVFGSSEQLSVDPPDALAVDGAALIQALHNGQPDQAQEQVNAMILLWQSSSATVETIHMQSFRLVVALVELIRALHLDALQDQAFRLFEYTTLEEYEQRLRLLCQNICQAIRQNDQDEGKRSLQQILDYVHRYYSDPALSLISIAEALNKSPSYLSKCFQEHLDTSPGRYIEMLRMDNARDLLIRTDLRVKDIVEQVGYQDASSFSRKFRTKEGITPNQYRALHRIPR